MLLSRWASATRVRARPRLAHFVRSASASSSSSSSAADTLPSRVEVGAGASAVAATAAAAVDNGGTRPVSGAIHRKSRDVWRRRLKWSIGAGLLGAGLYLVNDRFGTPEKTAAFFFEQLSQAQTADSRLHLLNALQMGADASDAVRQGIVDCGGLAQLRDLFADANLDVQRMAAAIVMDVSQNPDLTASISTCPGLLERILENTASANKEIIMNSLLTLTIVTGAGPEPKLRAFEAGALSALIRLVRHSDLDVAHVACTAIGSLVKGFPQVDRLVASLPKKDRITVVAAISQLGQSYVQQGQRGAAVDAFRTSLLLDPANPNIHNVLGQLLQMSGRISEANDHFRLAIKFAPGLLEAHYNLAVNLTSNGSRADKVEAVHRMRAALPYADPSHPNRSDLMFLLAKTLTSLDRVPEARRVYEEMVQQTPGLWRAHLALGRLHLKLDDTRRALSSLQTAALLQPHDSQVHYQLALCQYRANNFAQAAVDCDKALELCAEGTAMPNGYLLRGKLHALDGQWASALDCFRRLVDLRPNQPEAYYQVSRALQNLGRWDEADAALGQTLDCWSRQIASMPAASSRQYFKNRPANSRILDSIEARCLMPAETPEHKALVRKYNALRAAVI